MKNEIASKLKTYQRAAKKFKGFTLESLDHALIMNGNFYLTDFETTLIIKNFMPGRITAAVSNIQLMDILVSLNDTPDFSLENNGSSPGNFVIRSGTDKISLNCYDLEEMPDYNLTAEFNNKFTIPAEDLSSIFTAHNFISEDEMRPAMQFVYLNHDIAATNGHFLYYKESKSKLDEVYLINSLVIELLKIFKPAEVELTEGKGVFVINPEHKHYKFSFDNIEIIWRNANMRYPDYLSVIPHKSDLDTELEVKKADLLKSIKKCGLVKNKVPRIGFDLSDIGSETEITAFAENTDTGVSIQSKIPAKLKSPEQFKVGVNSKLLTEIINNIQDETLKFQLTSPSKAMIINDNFLLMPVRLNHN